MRKQKNNNLFARLAAYLLLPGFLVLLVSGCSYPSKDHPEQVDAILKQIDTFPEYSVKRLQALDSFYRHIEIPGVEDRLKVYGYKCSFFQQQRDLAKAFQYADSTLDLTAERPEQTKYAPWQAAALASKGDIYLTLKNYEECFTYYTRARVVAEGISADACEAKKNYDQRLADLMYKQKKFRDAANYFRIALQEFNCSTSKNEFQRFVYTQEDYDNIGECYARLDEWDSAAFYFNTAFGYIVANESTFPNRKPFIVNAKAVVWGNLAAYCVQTNHTARAESLYVKAINCFVRNDTYAQNLQMELADLFAAEKRFSEAIRLLQQVKDSMSTVSNENNRLKYYQSMAGYYSKRGEDAEAVTYLRKYISYKDSTTRANLKFNSVDIVTDMEKRYQQELNDSLRKDNQLKQLYLVIAVLTAAIIMILFSFLLFNFKRQSKLRHDLALKDERERISKELHDDLGSGLTALQIMIRRVINNHRTADSYAALNDIAVVSDELVDQMSEAVWMLNNTGDTLSNLLAHLRAYMAGYLEKTGIDLDLEFSNKCTRNYIISHLLRRNLLMIIKEVFTNVIKHAGATKFSLQTICREKMLAITLQDNGRGLPASPPNGNGLGNIRSRVRSLNGSVAFNSKDGLSIEIELPV